MFMSPNTELKGALSSSLVYLPKNLLILAEQNPKKNWKNVG